MRQGVHVTTRMLQRHGEVVVRVGELRIEFDGTSEQFDGFPKTPCLEIKKSEVVRSFGLRRIDGHGPRKQYFGFDEVPVEPSENAKIGVRTRKSGIEFDGPTVRIFRS